jgi:P-type E1-E2 ATPase
VASVEAASGHPIGKAVALGADEREIALLTPEQVESMSGLGVVGTIEGVEVVVGKEKLVADRGLLVDDRWRTALEALESEGKTSFLAGWDGEVKGVIAVADTVRDGSREAVGRLARSGVDSVMVTGDNQRTAAWIAEQTGITSVHAEVMPGDKAHLVAEVQKGGQVVAFVGDGINDAPALIQADLGLAVGTGTDVALEAGDVVLLNGDPRLVATAIDLAASTYRVIRQNLFWAFGYNVAAIPLAAVGRLDPMIAAAAMAFSSLSVVLNALRLKRYQPPAL